MTSLLKPSVVNLVCYSYKGGSGRTTASVNLAFELARQGNLVGSIDMDIDAPGQHMLILEWLAGQIPPVDESILRQIRSNAGKVGLQNYFNCQAAPGKDPLEALKESTLDMRAVNPAFVGRGELEFYFASTMQRSFRDLEVGTKERYDIFRTKYLAFQEQIGVRLLKKAIDNNPVQESSDEIYAKARREQLRRAFMVVDAPNGVNSVSLPLLKNADLILVFFRHSVQHVEGTIETVRKLHTYLYDEFQRRYLRILLVGSCFPEDLCGAVNQHCLRAGVLLDPDVARMKRKFDDIQSRIDDLCGRYDEVISFDHLPENDLLKVLEQPIIGEGFSRRTLFGEAADDVPISRASRAKLRSIAKTLGEVGGTIAGMKRTYE